MTYRTYQEVALEELGKLAGAASDPRVNDAQRELVAAADETIRAAGDEFWRNLAARCSSPVDGVRCVLRGIVTGKPYVEGL